MTGRPLSLRDFVPDRPLSPRELEVVRLVAQGLTNKQVAEQLSLSKSTVGTHMDHVRDKLGLRKRVQIANWLRDNDAATAAGEENQDA